MLVEMCGASVLICVSHTPRITPTIGWNLFGKLRLDPAEDRCHARMSGWRSAFDRRSEEEEYRSKVNKIAAWRNPDGDDAMLTVLRICANVPQQSRSNSAMTSRIVSVYKPTSLQISEQLSCFRSLHFHRRDPGSKRRLERATLPLVTIKTEPSAEPAGKIPFTIARLSSSPIMNTCAEIFRLRRVLSLLTTSSPNRKLLQWPPPPSKACTRFWQLDSGLTVARRSRQPQLSLTWSR